MRVAVTGPHGRLGSALLQALGPDGMAWGRADVDLDSTTAIETPFLRDRPDLVIHAAAWTDVDGCALDPGLALKRNGDATGRIARACASHGSRLIMISTNEVFDGLRTDGRPYAADTPPSPGNAYGLSKLAGERAASEAFADADADLAIVRTAWLYGPPGRDFPDKILDAAARATDAGTSMRLVSDELGNPTYVADLARAILSLAAVDFRTSIHHVTNSGWASRADWAREVLQIAGLDDLPIEDVSWRTWSRPSNPPPRAILEPTDIPGGVALRDWRAATHEYVPALLQARLEREAAVQ